MKSKVDLLASYWTISCGLPHTDKEYSPFDFRDRVESAARAGFTGFGIWHADLEHVLRTRTLKEMKQILDDNGIKYIELEFLTDWFLDGDRKRQSDICKKLLLDAKVIAREGEPGLEAAVIHVSAGDIRDEAFCQELVARAVEGLGGLDIVVNNASRDRCREHSRLLPILPRAPTTSPPVMRPPRAALLAHSRRAPKSCVCGPPTSAMAKASRRAIEPTSRNSSPRAPA